MRCIVELNYPKMNTTLKNYDCRTNENNMRNISLRLHEIIILLPRFLKGTILGRIIEVQ